MIDALQPAPRADRNSASRNSASQNSASRIAVSTTGHVPTFFTRARHDFF